MKNIISLFVLICTCFIISCRPSKTIADTSCPGYKSPDFNRSDISKYGIGIMPVLGGKEKEQYRRPMGDEITKFMREEFGSTNVKSPNEVISILNDAGLADEYANAISYYTTSGIVSKDLLQRIGNALSVDYLLYVKLLDDTDIDYQNFGSYGTQTYVVYELYVQTQVWSTRLGDVVWEGKGGFAEYKHHNIDLVEKSAEGITKIVGNKKYEGPCEKTGDIFRSVKKATTWNIIFIGGTTCLLLLSLIPLATL